MRIETEMEILCDEFVKKVEDILKTKKGFLDSYEIQRLKFVKRSMKRIIRVSQTIQNAKEYEKMYIE